MEMRKKLARMLRCWASMLDPLDFQPDYKDIKILRRRDIYRDTSNPFLSLENRIKLIQQKQRLDIEGELCQYMVVNSSVYSTHTMIETRITVLVE